MNLYTTTIQAINPKTNELEFFGGPYVPGISVFDAQEYCENNGLGYCKVERLLVADIPCIGDTCEPDWDKMHEFDNLN